MKYDMIIAKKMYLWERDLPFVYVTIDWTGESRKSGTGISKLTVSQSIKLPLCNGSHESSIDVGKTLPQALRKHIVINGFAYKGGGLFVSESDPEEVVHMDVAQMSLRWEIPPDKKIMKVVTPGKAVLTADDGHVVRGATYGGEQKFYLVDGDRVYVDIDSKKYVVSPSYGKGVKRIA